MGLLMPLTTLIEWVWCAAQVGATYVEIGLFLVAMLLLCAICWHMYSARGTGPVGGKFKS